MKCSYRLASLLLSLSLLVLAGAAVADVSVETGNLCATKIEDVNLDDQCDVGPEFVGDAPVPDWWICIVSSVGDTLCQQTDGSGVTCWFDLPAGDYHVFEPAVAGWYPIGPESYDVIVGPAEPVDLFFCNAQMQSATEENAWGEVKRIFR